MKVRVSQLRSLVPLGLRQEWHYWRRCAGDLVAGQRYRRNTISTLDGDWAHSISLEQPIRRGAYFDNKLHNLSLGASRVTGSIILPGERWSFWTTVGRATAAAGFAQGRNLVSGRVQAEVGGGLCQLSSILYHLALISGLEIIERHPHSIDIYQEHERFTPLGADATVSWGSKDFRLRNPHRVAVAFDVSLRAEGTEWVLVANCRFQGEGQAALIEPRRVEFLRTPLADGTTQVETVVNGRVHTVTMYRRAERG